MLTVKTNFLDGDNMIFTADLIEVDGNWIRIRSKEMPTESIDIEYSNEEEAQEIYTQMCSMVEFNKNLEAGFDKVQCIKRLFDQWEGAIVTTVYELHESESAQELQDRKERFIEDLRKEWTGR